MIHSMAGGKLGNIEYNDFAKVRILDGENQGQAFFFITKILDLKVGDEVYVPLGLNNIKTLGKVERIDKHISSQCSPIPVKKAKLIISKKGS